MKHLDVVLSHSEVNNRYGTGVLLQRMFPSHSDDVVSIRSISIWDREQEFGARQLVIPTGLNRAAIYSWVLDQTRDFTVQRIYCIPYASEEITASIALRDAWQAPFCLYVMDDRNVATQGIPDELLAEAIGKARLRLVISSDMRDAYEAKYGHKFWIAPPTVSGYTVSSMPARAPDLGRGILIGNISTQEWLDAFSETIRGTTLEVDWYSNSRGGGYWLQSSSLDALQDAGIVLHDPLPEEGLAAELAKYEFALIPTMPPKGKMENFAIAALSLPSRLTFLVGACDLPIIVLGDPDSCVSRFTEHFGLGISCPYDPTALNATVAQTRDPSWRTRQGASLRRLRRVLAHTNIATWIRDSLVLGAPADAAFEALEVLPRRFPAGYHDEPVSAGPWLHEYDSVHGALERLAQSGIAPDFVIDVGAASGAWSHVAAMSFPSARFILIEPVYESYVELMETRLRGYLLRRNGLEVCQVALSSYDGDGFMKRQTSLQDASLVATPVDSSAEALPVRVRRLDSLAGELRLAGRGMINVDVAAGQFDVLQGAKDLLESSVDTLIIRAPVSSIAQSTPETHAIEALLGELGFVMRDVATTRRDPESGVVLGTDLLFARAMVRH